MYIPEKLKLNKFKKVAIPSKAEYMARFGAIDNDRPMSGEMEVEPQKRTTDMMQDFDNWDKTNAVQHTKAKTE